MKVLFLVPYPTKGPSNRYRVEQFLPFLSQKGIKYEISPFMIDKHYDLIYQRGYVLKKSIYTIQSLIKRLSELKKIKEYDAIFIHIECLPFGPAILERIYTSFKKPIIFDFEDAIYLPRTGKNKLLNLIKNPYKFYDILKLSSEIIVCNSYLEKTMAEHNPRVNLIPTSIDLKRFGLKKYRKKTSSEEIIIGWIGSPTTFPCLKPFETVFKRLSEKYNIVLKLVGVNKKVEIKGVKVITKSWDLNSEVEDFQDIDIGIYPLPDNEWVKAKTPFKTIQYMAVGVPCVVSRVGGNIDIVQDGINGFLAGKEEEWVDKISRLIENPDMRESIGKAGRKRVEEKYSLEVNAPKFLNVIMSAVSCKRG